MTQRAVFIGLLGAVVLCGSCFFNDAIVRQTVFIRNFMPISVFGTLLLLVFAVNPLLGRLRRGIALRGREMAVVFGLMLVSAYVPGYGLTQYLPVVLMMPHHYARTDSAWIGEDIVKAAPTFMLADTSRNEDTVLTGYVMGLSDGDRHMPFSAIPWYAWRETLAFWLPLLLTLAVMSIAMALIVHRQWSENEHLPYPLAGFATALLPGDSGGEVPANRRRLFWIGFAPVAAIHLINWAAVWFPDRMVSVPLQLPLGPLGSLFPMIVEGGGGNLFTPLVIFTVIGFAYFLSTDVSFSLGIAAPVTFLAFGALMRYGVSVHGGGYAVSLNTGLYGGAYFGLFAFLLYTGRSHYIAIMRRAFAFRLGREHARSTVSPRFFEIWAARVFALTFAAMVLQISLAGIDWPLAFLFTASAVILLVAISRAVAETGVFYIYPVFGPCTIIAGFLGYRALGAETTLALLLVATVLFVNPSETLMPFVVNANRVFAQRNVHVGKAAPFVLLAVILGFAVAFPTTLYWHYNRGARQVGHGWIIHSVPRYAFSDAIDVRQRLEAQGMAKTSAALSGWQRVTHIDPDIRCVSGFVVTFTLVLLFGVARMKFWWWPLHPILFLILGTWQSQVLAFSFLLGWAVKIGVTRYGGAGFYSHLKPLMIGLIAGEVFVAILTMIFGALFYVTTGELPKTFAVLPI